MKRRQFVKAGTTLISTMPFVRLNSFDTYPANQVADTEVVRRKVGKIKCTIFKDTMHKYLAKDFFINAGKEEVEAGLIKYNATPDNIPSPFIAMLVQVDKRKVLIDTGVGFSDKPIIVRDRTYTFKGKLLQLLAEEGIKREDITDVIVTHFHPDHIGGIYNQHDMLNFQNARFHVDQDEWNYWHTSASQHQPEQFKFFINRNITPLKDGNLNMVSGDFTEILPGITVVKAGGHTAGQIALIIGSKKDKLLYISDAFLHPLHIEKLDWQTNYDSDHEKAKQTRMKLIDLAYKENMLVNSFHFDFPGLGRIDKMNNNAVWRYTNE